MDNVKISKKIQINLTANQWELYDTNMLGADKVASVLNQGMEIILNGSHNRINKENKIDSLLRAFSEFGSNDSEPRFVAYKLLEEMYS